MEKRTDKVFPEYDYIKKEKKAGFTINYYTRLRRKYNNKWYLTSFTQGYFINTIYGNEKDKQILSETQDVFKDKCNEAILSHEVDVNLIFTDGSKVSVLDNNQN